MGIGFKPKSSIGEEIIRKDGWETKTVPGVFINALIGKTLETKEGQTLTSNPHQGVYKEGAKLINIINDRQKTFPLIVGLLNQIAPTYERLCQKEEQKKSMVDGGESVDLELFLEAEELKTSLDKFIDDFRNTINSSTINYLAFSGVDKVTGIGDIAVFFDSFRQFLASDKDENTRMLAKDLMHEGNSNDGVVRKRVEEVEKKENE